MASDPVPYEFLTGGEAIAYYVLCGVGFLLAAISFVVQSLDSAPYGRHFTKDKAWGFMINQRLGHIISDFPTGFLTFLLAFVFMGNTPPEGAPNITLAACWLAHYFHRGLIHPLIMEYSDKTVPIGITLGGIFPNTLFSFVNGWFLGTAKFQSGYPKDPRFIIGLCIFVIGFVVNKWADLRIRKLRQKKSLIANESKNKDSQKKKRYVVPHGGLFEYIACPNYFGEMLEWLGFALASWSLSGLAWFLFCSSTFIPRSKDNLNWYKKTFASSFPANRRALIPFIY